jgi:hypothetical protein
MPVGGLLPGVGDWSRRVWVVRMLVCLLAAIVVGAMLWVTCGGMGVQGTCGGMGVLLVYVVHGGWISMHSDAWISVCFVTCL